MFGLDRAWWLIPLVLIVVLIIWGPGRMPEVGAGLGRAIREFRNAMTGVHDSVVNSTAMPANPAAAAPGAPTPSTSEATPTPGEPPAASYHSVDSILRSGAATSAPSEQPAAAVPDETRPN
jgi:sec-independent protein translocase protein TatA